MRICIKENIEEGRIMLIDFHTHIYPDKIAAATIAKLKEGILSQTGIEGISYADGTLDGLLSSMEENNVDTSVIMPIVTNPEKWENVNRYAKESERDGKIIAFASVHPLQPDLEEAMESIKEQGYAGIKLHPEFQKVYIDSKESIKLFKKAEELGLLVIFHAGQDIGLPPPVHALPERVKNLLEYVSGDNIIAAHLGGWNVWEDVEKYLVGTPIYMDTAFIKDYIDPDLCKRIIKGHGTDKILFGSDSPWERPAETLSFLESIGLTEEELEDIKWKNATKLLGI